MALADNIKYLRESKGMSQQELASALGVTDGAVSQWETGQTAPRMGNIEKMVALFLVKKSILLDGDVRQLEKMIVNNDIERFANLFQDLSRDDKKAAISYLEWLRDKK